MSQGNEGAHAGPGRVILGFLLAPLAIVPATALLLIAGYIFRLGGFDRDTPPLMILTSLVIICMFGLPMAYLASVLLGIPLYFVARRRGPVSFGLSLLIGAGVAWLPLWSFFAYVAAMDGLGVVRGVGSALAWTTLFTACGAWAGAAFWWIALRPRDGSASRAPEA